MKKPSILFFLAFPNICFAFLSFFLISCDGNNQAKITNTKTVPFTGWHQQSAANYSQLQVLEIDGCEYLFGPWGNGTVLTHRGNCQYCLERASNQNKSKIED